MTLRAHIRTALAGTTSQAPIDTATLAQGRSLCAIKAELMAMYKAREVMCCEFFKGNAKPVVRWWSVGNVIVPPMNRSRAAKARKKREDVEDE
mgnify:CR=1 FL=1